MKWEENENNEAYHSISVEADWSELSDDYDRIVTKYAKVPAPGFRSGKVPKNIIEMRFQKEIIDELSRISAQRFGREAVQESGVKVLGHVEAEEIECAKGRTFRAKLRFHLMPKIDLPDIGSLGVDDRDADFRDQISLRLLESVNFDVPEVLVRDELSLDGIGESAPESAQWKAASDRIKLMLILKQVARQEGIEVDEADVNDRIAEKAKEFKTTIKSLHKELENGGGIQRLRNMLLAERTLEYLIEKNG